MKSNLWQADEDAHEGTVWPTVQIVIAITVWPSRSADHLGEPGSTDSSKTQVPSNGKECWACPNKQYRKYRGDVP